MKKIKNILFDLGGVLFPLSVQASLDAFVGECGVTTQQIDKWLRDDDMFFRFETGKCTTDEFLARFNAICNKDIDIRTFNRCWNAMILGYPDHSREILEDVHNRGYNLYILSNINEPHVNYVEELAQWPQNLFVKKYYSNEIHQRKPDREAYEHVIGDSGIDPEETIYIDDRADNAATGRSFGFITINPPQNGYWYGELQDLLR